MPISAWYCFLIIFLLLRAGIAEANPGAYFMAIHCDPQWAGEEDWEALEDLVAAADSRELKLTIQFNPLWASTLQANSGRLIKVSNWVANGHELGGHHHVFTHPGGWDGYSNQTIAQSSPLLVGDMQDWIADLESALNGAAAVVTVSSKDYDFPSNVDFQTGGSFSTASPSDAARTPQIVPINGRPVWNLTHAALIAGGVWQIDDMKDAFLAATGEEVFGAAFHPQDYYEGSRDEVDEWLDFLVSQDSDGADSKTAGAILVAFRSGVSTGLPLAGSAGRVGLLIMLLAGALLALHPLRRRGKTRSSAP